MTALEFMGWEIPENWEDAGSYFEKEDGSTGFIKAIPLKTWKHGQWVVPDKDYSGHSYLLEDPMFLCPFTWREIQELSAIEIVCDSDMNMDTDGWFWNDRLYYHIIGKAASREEIHRMEERILELDAFQERHLPENEEVMTMPYCWHACVVRGPFCAIWEREACDWWYGLDGILDEWSSAYVKRCDICGFLYEWCHLLAACPGIDVVMAATQACPDDSVRGDRAQMEHWLSKHGDFEIHAVGNRVELRKLNGFVSRRYREYEKKYKQKRKADFRPTW